MKRGVTSSDHWFYIASAASRDMAASGTVSRERIQRRLDLMLCWWKHRRNGTFIQTDSGRLLDAIHESGEMDLTNEEGRLDELRAYWALVFVCAHDSWLWDVRDHWEHALLKWRVAHFYCHEHHLSTSLRNNIALCPVLGYLALEEVHPLVVEAYGRRFPGAPVPGTWVKVPFESMPPSAMAHPDWDVRDGGVVITFRDFVPWAWHQMVRATDDTNRRIHVARWDDELEADKLVYDQGMREFLEPFMERCQKVRDEEREAVRQAQARQAVNATLPSVNTGEELLIAVKSRLPLCMLQHFWLAFAKGKHPKHHSRVALAKFLLEAGYSIHQVDVVMFGLFTLDRDFIRGYGGVSDSGWNDAAYHKKFGLQVVDMHRKGVAKDSFKAFGCATLIKAGQDGETRGCPLFKTGPNALKDVAVMLDWAGVPMPDIEDIVGREVRDGQMRCQCDFSKRSLLRGTGPEFIIRHPNSYMRGYNKYTGSTADGRPKEEIQ
jgi:hypothetical protein